MGQGAPVLVDGVACATAQLPVQACPKPRKMEVEGTGKGTGKEMDRNGEVRGRQAEWKGPSLSLAQRSGTHCQTSSATHRYRLTVYVASLNILVCRLGLVYTAH